MLIAYCGSKELYNYLELLRWLVSTKACVTDVDIQLFIYRKTYITDADK